MTFHFLVILLLSPNMNLKRNVFTPILIANLVRPIGLMRLRPAKRADFHRNAIQELLTKFRALWPQCCRDRSMHVQFRVKTRKNRNTSANRLNTFLLTPKPLLQITPRKSNVVVKWPKLTMICVCQLNNSKFHSFPTCYCSNVKITLLRHVRLSSSPKMRFFLQIFLERKTPVVRSDTSLDHSPEGH